MNPREFKISVAIFSLVIIASSVLYYNRPNPYVRPEPYFYLLSIAAGIVFLQIMSVKNKNTLQFFVIFTEILLISISFTLTQQALYQTVIGRDPWGHMVLTTQILKQGHIPNPSEAWLYSVYTKMPEFHVLNAYAMLVGNLRYKWAYLAVGIGVALSLTLFIGALVAHVFEEHSPKLALLAMFFTATADNVLDMSGKSIIPNALGMVLVLAVLYVLLVLLPKVHHRALFLLFLVSFSLVFMHSVSYGFLLIELAIFLMLLLVVKRREIKTANVLGGVVLALTILAFLEWGILNDYYLGQGVLLFKLLFFGTGIEMYEQGISGIPFDLIILARLGMLVYFAIAGLSLLREFLHSVKGQNEVSFQKLAFIVESMFFVGIAPVITFFWAPIAHRFWYYGEVLGSTFVGLVFLRQSTKYRHLGKFVRASALSILIFLTLTASVANDDNPLVPQYTLRTGWYDSEISGAYFVINNVNQPIASDVDYAVNIERISKIIQKPTILDISPPTTFKEAMAGKNSVFLVRKELIETRFFFLGKGYKNAPYLSLGNKTAKILSELAVYRGIIYNNGNVLMYGNIKCS